jgi:dolichol kinase
MKRKALHLFPAIVIISIWIFSVKIWDGVLEQDLIWGINGYQYATFLIITVGYSGILVFAALDYIRLSYIFKNHNYFYLIPDNVLDLLSESMKERELYEFTKPVALVLTLAPLFFLPFGIFSAIALISTIGDGAASLFGLKFGKKSISKNSNKTISGYFAGFTISFLVGFISFLLFLPTLMLLKMIIMALMGAGMFLLIDLIPIRVDDNILNPLLSALGIITVYIFL